MSSARARRLLPRAALAGGAASLALLLGTAAPSQAAASGCTQVRGSYVEHAVTDGCLSPVGLCIAGTYQGQIQGDFEGAASSIATTADTPATGAATFTSDSTIHARLAGRTGTLLVKNAGVFSSAVGGPIVDLQTVVGGTGELAGARGAVRASGTFSADGGGRSEYEGIVCLP